jgi:hypothetical protein
MELLRRLQKKILAQRRERGQRGSLIAEQPLETFAKFSGRSSKFEYS